MTKSDDWLQPFLDQVVILDLTNDYLAIGLLVAIGEHHLDLTGADLHDHNEANCTKEVYAVESKQLGVRANRSRVAIPRERLLAISRLADV